MRPASYEPRLAGPKKIPFKMMNRRKADVSENTKTSWANQECLRLENERSESEQRRTANEIK